ncbi:MAG: AEC family transporter [Halothermotrichaceae bacterium]
MDIFTFVFLNNILPLFIIVFLGYFLATKFKLDVFTLSKIYIYILLPVLTSMKIYQTDINTEFFSAILFGIIMIILLAVVGWVISRLLNYNVSISNAFYNSIMFYNSGNFGLPLIMLVFSNTPQTSFAVSIQIIILTVQNLATYSIGFFNAGRGQMHYLDTIKKILKTPILYAILTAFILKYLNIDLTKYFFWSSIEHLQGGLIPVALLTLGVQLYHTKINFKNWDVYIASLTRLIGGPILAYILINIMGIEGVMAQVLFISSAVPSAVNTALIAIEFNNKPDFASQVVMTSTVLSSITLTGVIFLSEYLF